MAITKNSQIDLNGNEMILDADGDTTITADTDDQIDFKTAGTDRVTIGASGNLFVGSSTSNGISDGTTGLQVTGAGFNGAISASRHDNNQYGSSLMLGKSRNTTVGSNTIVQDNDGVGAIGFFADDGTNLDSQVAYISASVDGTPGANDTPGRLTFSTTADGSAAVTERMRITSAGKVGIGDSSPSKTLTISGDNAEFLLNRTGSYADTINMGMPSGVPTIVGGTDLAFGGNGTWNEKMRISGDNVFIKTTDPSQSSSSGVKFVNTRLYMVNALTSGEQISYYGNGGYKYYVSVGGKIHTAVGPAVYSVSDERLKENIRDYDKGLADILKLKPRLFDWKEGEGSNEKNVSGFVAQECEAAGFDEFVGDFKHDTLTDAKSFGAGGLIPALVKAIQEQQEQIEAMQAEINTLKGE